MEGRFTHKPCTSTYQICSLLQSYINFKYANPLCGLSIFSLCVCWARWYTSIRLETHSKSHTERPQQRRWKNHTHIHSQAHTHQMNVENTENVWIAVHWSHRTALCGLMDWWVGETVKWGSVIIIISHDCVWSQVERPFGVDWRRRWCVHLACTKNTITIIIIITNWICRRGRGINLPVFCFCLNEPSSEFDVEVIRIYCNRFKSSTLSYFSPLCGGRVLHSLNRTYHSSNDEKHFSITLTRHTRHTVVAVVVVAHTFFPLRACRKVKHSVAARHP